MDQTKPIKTHIPVLLEESIELLRIDSDGFYVDCTLGEGGHSTQILKNLDRNGLLLSIDQDQNAIDFVKTYYSKDREVSSALESGRWIIAKGNFSRLKRLVEQSSSRRPDGILMDIGISSRQLDIPGRGFSFNDTDSALDMRMDADSAVKANDLLKVFNEKELANLIFRFSQERFSRAIARAIKSSNEPIEKVGQLVQIINRAVPAAVSPTDTARRVFQALRIAVNDELGSLQSGLEQAFELLNHEGRLVVITFHSLEDRIVKRYFESLVKSEQASLVIRKPVAPTEREVAQNPRSRSAKVRAIEKIITAQNEKSQTNNKKSV